jgi:hypothetical protein
MSAVSISTSVSVKKFLRQSESHISIKLIYFQLTPIVHWIMSSPQSSTARGKTLPDEIERELGEGWGKDDEAQRQYEILIARAEREERELRAWIEAEKASMERHREEMEQRQEMEQQEEMKLQQEMKKAAAVEKRSERPLPALPPPAQVVPTGYKRGESQLGNTAQTQNVRYPHSLPQSELIKKEDKSSCLLM